MTDTTAKGSETQRVNIVTDGDLILIISNNYELRVHSFTLKTNSPVFNVMLGPHWLEGQSLANISSTAPGTLKLPDDDSEAMKYLCLMLHNCHDELMIPPSHALLLEIAKAADKYRCISSTRLIFELWISRLGNLKYYEIEYSHLTTAYILEDAAVFEDLSRQVLMKSSPHEFRIFCKSATGRDDFGIVAAFMLRYALLRNIVIGGVDRMVEEMCKLLGPDMKHYVDNIPGITDEDAKQFVRRRRGGLPKFCDYYQKMTAEHLALFAEARIWPDCRAEGLESLIQKLKHFKLPEIHFDDGQCMREDFWEDNWFISDLPPALAALKAIADHVDTALCVHCVRSADGAGCAEHQGLRVIPSLSKQTLMTVHLEQVRFEYGDL